MRTPGWRSNTTAGPVAVVRCQCGGVFARLAEEEQITTDKRVAAQSLGCDNCGQCLKARIYDDRNTT